MNEALLYTKDKTSLCTNFYCDCWYPIILCPWNTNFCESLGVVLWLEIVYDLMVGEAALFPKAADNILL